MDHVPSGPSAIANLMRRIVDVSQGVQNQIVLKCDRCNMPDNNLRYGQIMDKAEYLSPPPPPTMCSGLSVSH